MVTGERANDHRTLQMGPLVEGRLVLFDLGYLRYQLFDFIARNGGYFITRLAINADPRIVAAHRQWRGRAIDLTGKRLKELSSRLQRDFIDVEVEVEFQRRVYAGTRRNVRPHLRLVADRLPETTKYRFYLTNINLDSLDAHAVGQTHAARWKIELIFKELRSHFRLDELPTRKAHIVETLRIGAVITLLVSLRLLQDVRERLRRTPYRCPSNAGLPSSPQPRPRYLVLSCCRRECRWSLPAALNQCCSRRQLTRIGRAGCSSSASNPAPLGRSSMQISPLTDHGWCTWCAFLLSQYDSFKVYSTGPTK